MASAVVSPVEEGGQPTELAERQTGLVVPHQAGAWFLARGWESFPERALGASAHYHHPSDVTVTVYVYDYGVPLSLEGASPQVWSHLRETLAEIAARQADLGLRLTSGFEVDTRVFGSPQSPVEWLRAAVPAESEGRWVHLRIYITGWRDYFVKIRSTINRPRGAQHDEPIVESLLETLSGCLGRAPQKR